MKTEILNLDARVVFFPVRHHSPTAALLVAQLIKTMRPEAVLIEGPADFNPQMHELFLEHKLPVAIYTYLRTAEMQRSAFYPFCAYSPEWVAAQTAHRQQAHVQFIDLPWRDMATKSARQHRYADGELRENKFIPLVCKRLGLESFDELWDELIEAQPSVDLHTYMVRCHNLCYQMRHSQRFAEDDDIVRERYMSERIIECSRRIKGRILVVTGGFHCHALFERLHGTLPSEEDMTHAQRRAAARAAGVPMPDDYAAVDFDDDENADDESAEDDEGDDDGAEVIPFARPSGPSEWGIALTPYSYRRLDGLTGYNAGMPSPGFYHQVFTDRQTGKQSETYRTMLFEAVKALREKKQQISSADLIAVETSAQALARMRGHTNVWRSDLIDGIMSALVKDEIAAGLEHPMLTAIHDALRGDDVGRLAEGTSLPPLVHNVLKILDSYNLASEQHRWMRIQKHELDLSDSEQLTKSQIFHQLEWLGIDGFRLESVGELTGDERGRVVEDWETKWSADLFYATCIEASMYGATLYEAASTLLLEKSRAPSTSSALAARLLAQACHMGTHDLSEDLRKHCRNMIRKDQEFPSVTRCVERLLFLYKYDQILFYKPIDQLRDLMHTGFDRAVWLLDTLGSGGATDMDSVMGIGTLVDVSQQCSDESALQKDYLLEVLLRVRLDGGQSPMIRGAATGALWSLGQTDSDSIEHDVGLFRSPEHIGDFLTGLFHRARQILQRKPELMVSLDQILLSFSEEQFLEAIPSMRQAFAYFSPREKHHLATAILKGTGAAGPAEPLAPLGVDTRTAERALAIEARVKKQQQRFGIRGGAAGGES